MSDYERFASERLREFTERVFRHFEVPEAEARLASEVLQTSDLRGIDSHGVARLDAYVGLLSVGRINPRPSISIVRETPSTATVDGDNGLGLVVGPQANAIAIEKASAVGTGWVTVRNTNHYGIAGYYALEAVRRGLIGWSMTNSTALVAPLWGAERRLGTNPISVGIPAGSGPPVVIDLATSACAYGKVEIARRKGEPIPEGWAVDSEGRDTTDPLAMVEGGALLPLGSDRERGGHKGYCLSLLVDILTSVLSGANWGPWAPPFALRQKEPERQVGQGIGHFFGAMQLEAFIDPEEFGRQMEDWVSVFRATKPAPGTDGPLIPGDPEREAEADRSVNGIPLVPAVIEDLRRVAKTTGVPFD